MAAGAAAGYTGEIMDSADKPDKPPWYAGGLAFECIQCGRCCSGPEEGHVWVSNAEIDRITEFLKTSGPHARRLFLRRVGGRNSLVEGPRSRDCVFLQQDGLGHRGCRIYPVRPMQCRTWPFWASNLATPECWCEATARCPGINRGPLHDRGVIERRKASRVD